MVPCASQAPPGGGDETLMEVLLKHLNIHGFTIAAPNGDPDLFEEEVWQNKPEFDYRKLILRSSSTCLDVGENTREKQSVHLPASSHLPHGQKRREAFAFGSRVDGLA